VLADVCSVEGDVDCVVFVDSVDGVFVVEVAEVGSFDASVADESFEAESVSARATPIP
jgi:hypothetical protein